MNLYTSMVFSSSLQSNYKISIVYTYLWHHYVPLWLLQPLQYIPEFADDLIDDFPGPANQTRCFTHVLNLVVKSIIRQFDLPNSRADKNQIFDEGTKELSSLAGNIDVEEEEASRDGEDGVAGEEDNVEEWIDECTLLDEEDLEELDKSVEPVRLVLTKVSKLFNM